MLNTMVPIAGRLEELGICFGFKSRLLVPGHRVLSTDCTVCSLRAMLFGGPPGDLTMVQTLVDKLLWCRHGQPVLVMDWCPPQEGQSGGGEKKEGFGLGQAVWPVANPTRSSTGYSRGEHVGGFRWNQGRSGVSDPAHQKTAEVCCPVACCHM